MLRPYIDRPLSLRPDREDGDPLDRLPRALRVEREPPQRRAVGPPPLDPRRRRHAEPIHVENAAAHAELRDFGHGRHAGVPHLLEAPHHLTEGTAPRSPPPPHGGSPPPPPAPRGRATAGCPRAPPARRSAPPTRVPS